MSKVNFTGYEMKPKALQLIASAWTPYIAAKLIPALTYEASILLGFAVGYTTAVVTLSFNDISLYFKVTK